GRAVNYWARYVTRVAVRRVVALLVLGVLAWAGIGRADAATVGADGCINNSDGCNRGQAYAAAVELANREGDRVCRLVGSADTTYLRPNVILNGVYQSGFSGDYASRVDCSNGAIGMHVGMRVWYGACPVGTEWNDEQKKC